jgi:putative membrane protein
MGLLIAWFISALAVWLTAKLLPGFQVAGFGGAVVVAAIVGVLDLLLDWLIHLVIGIATLGLGFIFSNVTHWIALAIILELADMLTRRLAIRNFGTALVASLCITVIGAIARSLLFHQHHV